MRRWIRAGAADGNAEHVWQKREKTTFCSFSADISRGLVAGIVGVCESLDKGKIVWGCWEDYSFMGV